MHNFNIIRKSAEIAGRTLTLETGRMAKQANGSVLLTYGGTSILITAVLSNQANEGTDFFPLTVDLAEKMYASGKIPGGFFKRETKPSTDATLQARMIDRSIRPLFPEGFRNPVHVVVTPLSYDGENGFGILGILGASAALCISDIPFHGPIAGVTVGILDGAYVMNPKTADMNESKLDLSIAGTESSIVMIEAGSKEISEAEILEAVYTGHEVIKQMIELQKEFVLAAGKEKIEVKLDIIPEDIIKKMESEFAAKVKAAAITKGKHERSAAFDVVKEEMIVSFQEFYGEDFEKNKRDIMNGFEELIRKSVREAILFDHHRVDGRGLDDIRPITCEVDILPRVHGSALFTRGETQSLGTVTLGSASDEQVIDSLEEEYKKSFYLHYNFPPYSVGETGGLRAPGRRELGHGALAEKSLKPVIPSKDVFPYTIRVVSDIMESNGSSSMASVCAGTLSLMAAGVPISNPVAGIANGLIMEGDKFVVLTDIMGLEDHLGDMDFKVAGTPNGITSMQMDIKIEGITKEIMSIALEKALVARLYILDKIKQTLPAYRAELCEYAPQIESFTINTAKIGEVIGQSGKTIKSIIERTKVEVNIDDTGLVSISSPNKDALAKAKAMIMNIITDPEFNQVYDGVVTRIESFGAFVKFMDGFKEGMIHISQLNVARIKNVEDVLKLGDNVKAKVIGNERGKISLSIKGIPGNPGFGQTFEEYHPSSEGSRDDNQDRSDRGDRRDFRRNDRFNNSRRRD